ncbi:hypothetical protein LOC67_18680 [Stieleria sp. JC731]|uniref:hypothetical protein n=1 Tax=Pirellulaceae TaxID=2691357 RepID=UPI001E585443|nr:hypothetical protein [Stieleria sp. JC731]MCC9602581.1 hypothetical protein [Stieleria sp. JC731]
MRFEQIIAVVARSLVIAGVREVKSVGTFARVSDLCLCMASVSPGKGMYLGHQPMLHQLQHHWNWDWNTSTADPATAITASKRKRSLAKRLLGLTGFGPNALHCRDC